MIYFCMCVCVYIVCIVGEQPSEFPSFDKNDSRGQEAVSKRLSVVSRVPFTEEQLFSVFDIVPGLEYCEVQRDPYSNYGKMTVLFKWFLSTTHLYTVYVTGSL